MEDFVFRDFCGIGEGREEVNVADGEHTRPRVFRAAPSLPGGWIQGSVSRRDLGRAIPEVPAKFTAGAPKTARDGACCPHGYCSRSFQPQLLVTPEMGH